MSFAATWINLDIIILSEVSQTKTDIWYHLYVKSKKMTQMNLFTKQKQTHIGNQLMVTKGKREGGLN